MFSKKATKIDKIFTPLIWHYVVSVKSAVKISSTFVAFLENTNFKKNRQIGLLCIVEKAQELLWVHGESELNFAQD